jgi:probable HAF family extracellular repeat protein
MKSRRFVCFATLLFSLVLSGHLSAKIAPSANRKPKHHHYKLVDLGTLGGPSGGIPGLGSPVLNHYGTLVGASDTAFPDPFDPNCFLDCYINHAWSWRNGVLTDLGALPGGASSYPYSVNAQDQIAGESQNGAVDPLTGWPEADAVVWKRGKITDLGTLGGTQSVAYANNDRGEVAGAATNGVADPFADTTVDAVVACNAGGGGTFATNILFFPSTTEVRAFRWTRATGMEDLGTLGGSDSGAYLMNNLGQVAGISFTSLVPNSNGAPTVDPFFWENGKMTDMGGLGGTWGVPVSLNNTGQVVGCSNLPGDVTTHPFLWTRTKGMQDLGTLGGTYGHANNISDSGDVVGFATTSGDEAGHAFLWRNGRMKDLGTVGNDPASESFSVNIRGQVVGVSYTLGADLHGFLWDNGGPIVDLNKLVVPPSDFTVISASAINDRGEIGCMGLGSGDTAKRPCVLIPCDEAHPGVEGCDYDVVDESFATQVP